MPPTLWRLPNRRLSSSRVLINVGGAAGSRSEERRVGKECRSLCDWSSDVCSSDLETVTRPRHAAYFVAFAEQAALVIQGPDQRRWRRRLEIGRASCRERV